MLGHYVFNASAIGLGGVLTVPKRKVIPSLASVALAPTGGEGAATVTNYNDGDGISFDRAETRVWGTGRNNVYATRADVTINNLDLFGQLQVETMWASVVSIRHVLDNGEVEDRKFTFQAEFIGVRVNGKEIEVPVDMTPFDENESYDKFVNALGTSKMADYRKLSGIDDLTCLDGRAVSCTAISKKAAQAIHVPVKGVGSGVGLAHLGEALIKPDRRRLTLLRLDLPGNPMQTVGTKALKRAVARTKDAPLARGFADDGSMTVGSVEGNGSQSYP